MYRIHPDGGLPVPEYAWSGLGQAWRRTTRRRAEGRSHSVRWERASGGQKAKVSATSLESSLLKGEKASARTTPRGGTRTRDQAPPGEPHTPRTPTNKPRVSPFVLIFDAGLLCCVCVYADMNIYTIIYTHIYIYIYIYIYIFIL